MLSGFERADDANLLVGFDTGDDACVYKISEEMALVQTVDFFTPVVDDPYIFGQIAAANALSDIYAMGGTPRIAMNILCVPNCLPETAIKSILEGGYDKIRESGAILAGGHTIEDNEPKYGLCVSAITPIKEILSNATAKEGDVLILTKPLGVGIVITAMKAGLTTSIESDAAIDQMVRLNSHACDAAKEFGAHACTDITGFGLLGHAYELADASSVSLEIDHTILPLHECALKYARYGIIPAGAYRNMDYLNDKVSFSSTVADEYRDIMADPQTSGGLLISAPENRAQDILRRLEGHCIAAVIGKVISKRERSIYVI